jgi:4-cresol dehydrogenase (hydroxylating)
MSTARLTTEHLFRRSLADAIAAWRGAVGEDRVTVDTARYAADTSSCTREIPVALRPESVRQVQDIVRIAQRFSIAIYPFGTGHNWGYGTSLPVRGVGAVVDLSSMNRVLDFDRELGVVTLEPGVTQGQLSEYLRSRGLPFLVPVTGAGPTCSILANALERGFGVTPFTDHFGAIMSMKVVLPGGEIYESYARAFDTAGAAQAFKWGTGPYFDGMFAQSNLGVVVDASIALQPKPERSGGLFFALDGNPDVEVVTSEIRTLLTDGGQNIGAINLMSRSRVECMLDGAHRIFGGPSQPIAGGASFGFGSVYGTTGHYRATCRLIRRSLRGRVRQLRILTAADAKRLARFARLAALVGFPQLAAQVGRLEAAISIVDGVPSTFALPLAYTKSGRPADSARLNPALDGCGLYWYAPIVPFRTGVAAQFIDFAESTCATYGLAAPITLTTLSPRCYASTIPLLFDRSDGASERQATRCFEELYRKGLALGFVPYRMGAQFMSGMRDGVGFGHLAGAVKHALDPNDVLSPGRYACGR